MTNRQIAETASDSQQKGWEQELQELRAARAASWLQPHDHVSVSASNGEFCRICGETL